MARLCLTALSDSCDFSDRILESDDHVEVGRADTEHRADVDNAFFNCKVRFLVETYRIMHMPSKIIDYKAISLCIQK